MRRISRMGLLLALLLGLLLTACDQEKEDLLSEAELTREASGEIVVGPETEDETEPLGTEGEVGEAASEEGTVETTETLTETTEGETAVTSGGEIGETQETGDTTPIPAPSTPESGEVTAEVSPEVSAEATTVAISESQEEVAESTEEETQAATAEEEEVVEATTTEPATTTIYTVQAGDTLYEVATRFGTTVEQLREMNGLTTNFITVGQELQVPAQEGATQPSAEQPTQPTSGPVTHTVQRGEWIYSIARQYNVSPQAILQANNLSNPNVIYPGQQLIIPTGN